MPATAPPRFGLTRMRPRDPSETHRAASSLELFFDLVFVVAVSLSSAQLHHAESGDHVVSGVGAYLMVFFAIWWAWMNFTWFATAFDTDDWLYRVVTILQMGGVLVLAAGAAPAMTEGDWTLVTIGYVIMRLAMVTQWLRASRGAPALRATALRYAAGIALVQVLWVVRLLLPEGGGVLLFLLLVLGSLGSSLAFGYGHYAVFASAGAFSAGIEVAIDHDTHSTGLAASAAAATLTVPVGVFILAVWVLTLRGALTPAQDLLVPVLAVAIAASALLPFSLPISAVLVVGIVVVLEVGGRGGPGRVSTGPADEGVA